MKQFLKILGKVVLTILAFIISCVASLIIVDKIFPEDVQNLSDMFARIMLSGTLDYISLVLIWDNK